MGIHGYQYYVSNDVDDLMTSGQNILSILSSLWAPINLVVTFEITQNEKLRGFLGVFFIKLHAYEDLPAARGCHYTLQTTCTYQSDCNLPVFVSASLKILEWRIQKSIEHTNVFISRWRIIQATLTTCIIE